MEFFILLGHFDSITARFFGALAAGSLYFILGYIGTKWPDLRRHFFD